MNRSIPSCHPLANTLLLAMCGVFSACGPSDPSAEMTCISDYDCPSYGCRSDGFCASVCSADPECVAPDYCRTNSTGDSYCDAPCISGTSVAGQGVCVEGRLVLCGSLQPADFDCRVCNCGAGEYCGTTDGLCQPQRAAGELCGSALECVTNRCEATQDDTVRCVVGPGDECTPESCSGLCVGACSPSCTSHASCGDDRYRCYATTTSGRFCRRYCDFATCPAGQVCRPVNDPDLLVTANFCFVP